MALHVVVPSRQDKPQRQVHLFIDEHSFIIKRIRNSDDYKLLNTVLEDYYGEDHEVQGNQLKQLLTEATTFEKTYGADFPPNVRIFYDGFLPLIAFAIENSNIIEFLTD